MKRSKRYNIFILISTIARNIVEIFSSVLLYKMGYSLRDILLFYAVLYLSGILVSIFSIYMTKFIKPKYILIGSSIIFSLSFYFMSVMEKNLLNLIIFSLIYSFGSYSYHSFRHYYAIKAIDKNKKQEIGNILIYSNVGIIITSLIFSYLQSKISILWLAIIIIILSVVAVIPIFRFDDEIDKEKIALEKIEKRKCLFFVFEQGKVLNLSLQPLYLYLFVAKKISYVGIFNVVMGISACVFIYFFVRKIDDEKYFKYLNMLFCLFLVLKLNVTNKYLILLIGFFEGIGVKMFEVVSTENIYDIGNNINVKGYLMVTETIFCLVRGILSLIAYVINDVKIILYLSIILVLITGFIKGAYIKK